MAIIAAATAATLIAAMIVRRATAAIVRRTDAINAQNAAKRASLERRLVAALQAARGVSRD